MGIVVDHYYLPKLNDNDNLVTLDNTKNKEPIMQNIKIVKPLSLWDCPVGISISLQGLILPATRSDTVWNNDGPGQLDYVSQSWRHGEFYRITTTDVESALFNRMMDNEGGVYTNNPLLRSAFRWFNNLNLWLEKVGMRYPSLIISIKEADPA